jgi:hypothetical protein
VKASTPLGDYPFEFRGIERREDGIAIVGLVAGMRSGVTIEPSDLARAARYLAPAAGALAAIVLLRRRLG